MTAPSELPDPAEPEALPYDCGGLGCGFQPCICDTGARAETYEQRHAAWVAETHRQLERLAESWGLRARAREGE